MVIFAIEKTNKMAENRIYYRKTKPTFLTPIEDLIAEDFGAKGTESRIAFDNACDAFIIGEKVKTERIKKGLTQEQLAQKIGTKKSYISRIENGHTDIQLSTLFRIFQGLGKQISFSIL